MGDKTYTDPKRVNDTAYGQGAPYHAQAPAGEGPAKTAAADPLTENVDANPLSSVGTTGQQRHYTQKKRAAKFAELWGLFRKNDQDATIRGFRPKEKTTSYMLELRSVSELDAKSFLGKAGSSSYDKLKV